MFLAADRAKGILHEIVVDRRQGLACLEELEEVELGRHKRSEGAPDGALAHAEQLRPLFGASNGVFERELECAVERRRRMTAALLPPPRLTHRGEGQMVGCSV